MDRELIWPAEAGPTWDESLEQIRRQLPGLRDEVSRLASQLAERRKWLTELEDTEERLIRWRAATPEAEAAGNSGTPEDAAAIRLDASTSEAVAGPMSTSASGGLGGPQTICDQITDIIGQRRDTRWRAEDVIAALRPENPDSVRALLGYMTREGILDKDSASGSYRLADTDPAAPEGEGDEGEQLHNVAYLDFGATRDGRRVMDFFATNHARAWRGSDVAKALGLTDIRALRRMLRALVKEGTLERRPSSRFQYSAASSEQPGTEGQAV